MYIVKLLSEVISSNPALIPTSPTAMVVLGRMQEGQYTQTVYNYIKTGQVIYPPITPLWGLPQ